MKHKDLETVAGQLRKPHGALGKETGEMMNKGNSVMNLATIWQLEPTANDKILEIGMGNGFFVKYILQNDKTIHYTGCDFSETMLQEAIILNQEYINNGQAQFTQANANLLPYDTGSFNTIFTVNTIYFWEDTDTVLSEIKRVLKTNGQLIISLRPKSIMENLPITKYGFNTFSKTDCIEMLVRNGFKIENVIEKEEPDIELSGEKFKNAFLVVKAIKEE